MSAYYNEHDKKAAARMTYASICDGIGAVHEAWKDMNWDCRWVSEIAPFPAAVVHHRWGFKNHGDFTQLPADVEPVRLVVAGTPCQDFSVAGLRAGVGGERGNLTLEFLKLLLRLRPTWVLWENVPGVLSSTSHVAPDPCPPPGGGLFVTHALRGEGHDASEDGTGRGTPLVPIAFDCKASGQNGFGVGEIASTLRGMGHANSHQNGGGHQAVCFDTTQITSKTNRSNPQPGDPCHPLCAGADAPTIAFNHNKSGNDGSSMGVAQDKTDCLRADSKAPFAVHHSKMAVRRLTPVECERLMGQHDNATRLPHRYPAHIAAGKDVPDGPRYKALGNSMVVQEFRWIGERIQMVESLVVEKSDSPPMGNVEKYA